MPQTKAKGKYCSFAKNMKLFRKIELQTKFTIYGTESQFYSLCFNSTNHWKTSLPVPDGILK